MAKSAAVLLSEAVGHSFSAPPTQYRRMRSRGPYGHTAGNKAQKAGGMRRVAGSVRVAAVVAAAVASMTYAVRCVVPRLPPTGGLQEKIKVQDGMNTSRRLAAGRADGFWTPRDGWSRAGAAPRAYPVECAVDSLEQLRSLETSSALSQLGLAERLALPGGQSPGLGAPAKRTDFRLFGDDSGRGPWHFSGSQLPALDLLDEPFPSAFILDPSDGPGLGGEGGGFQPRWEGDAGGGRPEGVPGGSTEFRLFAEQSVPKPWHFSGSQLPVLDLVDDSSSAFSLDSFGGDGEAIAPQPQGRGADREYRGGTTVGRPDGNSDGYAASVARSPPAIPGDARKVAAATSGATQQPAPPPVFGYFAYSTSEPAVPLLVPGPVFMKTIHAAGQSRRDGAVETSAESGNRANGPSPGGYGDAAGSRSAPESRPSASASPPLPYSVVVARNISDQATSNTEDKLPPTAGSASQATSPGKARRSAGSAKSQAAPTRPRAAIATAKSDPLPAAVGAKDSTRTRVSSRLAPLVRAFRASDTPTGGSGAGDMTGVAGGLEPSAPRSAPARFHEHGAQSANGHGPRQGKRRDETRRAVRAVELAGEGDGSGRRHKGQQRKQSDVPGGGDVGGRSSGAGNKGSVGRSSGEGGRGRSSQGAIGGRSTDHLSREGRQASASAGQERDTPSALRSEQAVDRAGGAVVRASGPSGAGSPSRSGRGTSRKEEHGQRGGGKGDRRREGDRERSGVEAETRKAEGERGADRDGKGRLDAGTEGTGKGKKRGEAPAPHVPAPVAEMALPGEVVTVTTEPQEEAASLISEEEQTAEGRADATTAGEKAAARNGGAEAGGGARRRQRGEKSKKRRTKGGPRSSLVSRSRQDSASVSQTSDSSGSSVEETAEAGRKPAPRSRAVTREVYRVRASVQSILKQLEGREGSTVHAARHAVDKLIDKVIDSSALQALQRFASRLVKGDLSREDLSAFEKAEREAVALLVDIKIFKHELRNALSTVRECIDELSKLLNSENESVVTTVTNMIGSLETTHQDVAKANVAANAVKVLEEEVKDILKKAYNYKLAVIGNGDLEAAQASFWRAVDKTGYVAPSRGKALPPPEPATVFSDAAEGGGGEGGKGDLFAVGEELNAGPSGFPRPSILFREPPPLALFPAVYQSLLATLQPQRQLLHRVLEDLQAKSTVDQALRAIRVIARIHAFFRYSKAVAEKWLHHYGLQSDGPFTVEQATARAILQGLAADSQTSLNMLQKWFHLVAFRRALLAF